VDADVVHVHRRRERHRDRQAGARVAQHVAVGDRAADGQIGDQVERAAELVGLGVDRLGLPAESVTISLSQPGPVAMDVTSVTRKNRELEPGMVGPQRISKPKGFGAELRCHRYGLGCSQL
jgi:hypothetical protein